MAKLKKEGRKVNLINKFKSMDTLSKSFVIGFGVSILILGGLTTNLVYQSHKAHLAEREYEDPSVNFYIIPPDGWTVTTPDRTSVEKVIRESSNKGKFDVTLHKLTEEIVPIVLLEDVKGSTEKGIQGSSFITVALRGYDKDRDRLYDKEFSKEYLGSLLNKLGVEDIKYEPVKKVKKSNLNGYVVKAKGVDTKVPVYYAQYQEIVGQNILTLTFGTTVEDEDAIEYLKDTSKYLRFKIIDRVEDAFNLLEDNIIEVDRDGNPIDKEEGKNENKEESKVGDKDKEGSKKEDKKTENTTESDSSKDK